MADTKISNLTAVSAGADAQELPCVDSSTTKKITVAQLLATAHSHTTGQVTALQEYVEDRVGAMATAGTGISLAYDDGAGTLTITATGSVSSEDIDDRVSALLTEGANVTITYDDTANTLTISAASGGGLGWYDVTDYGAVGNGSTDDRASIQSAIDAANTAGGGTVYFPPGTYAVKTRHASGNILRIVSYNNIHFAGAGQDVSIIKMPSGISWGCAGTASAGGASTITLQSNEVAVDDFFNGFTITLTGGTGSGQVRTVSDYVGSTKVLTVSSAWTTTPDSTSTYTMSGGTTISGTGDPHIFYCQDSTDLSWRDLTIDGNFEACSFTDEQAHGIWLQRCQRITLKNIKTYQLRGDGALLTSDSTSSKTTDFVAIGCRFIDNGRSGTAHQGNVSRVAYIGNFFDGVSDQAMDWEATGSRDGHEDITLIGNTINHTGTAVALALSGNTADRTKTGKRWRIIGNTIYGGSVTMGTLEDVVFQGNNVWNITTPAACMEISKNVSHAVISGNCFRQAYTTSQPAIKIDGTNATYYSDRVSFINNKVLHSGTNSAGIEISSRFNALEIKGNHIKATSGHTAGIFYRMLSASTPMEGLWIEDNIIEGFSPTGATGSVIYLKNDNPATSPITDVSISRNKGWNMATSTGYLIRLEAGSAWLTRLRIADNDVDATLVQTLIDADAHDFLIAGNGGALGVAVWVGTGSPESNVSARIGSTYHRIDGGASTSFYVKESGAGTNTGWVAK